MTAVGASSKSKAAIGGCECSSPLVRTITRSCCSLGSSAESLAVHKAELAEHLPGCLFAVSPDLPNSRLDAFQHLLAAAGGGAG